VASDAAGESRFVTVDDLDVKAWLGNTRPRVLAGLRTAMDTAVALRAHAALPFVLAPVPALGGETVPAARRPVRDRHLPLPRRCVRYLDGVSGQFGDVITAQARAEVVDLLAALHLSKVQAPPRPIELPCRGVIEVVLNEQDRPWSDGGPFAEQGRDVVVNGTREHVACETLPKGRLLRGLAT
jgi:spectinomycin phosphotransferase